MQGTATEPPGFPQGPHTPNVGADAAAASRGGREAPAEGVGR